MQKQKHFGAQFLHTTFFKRATLVNGGKFYSALVWKCTKGCSFQKTLLPAAMWLMGPELPTRHHTAQQWLVSADLPSLEMPDVGALHLPEKCFQRLIQNGCKCTSLLALLCTQTRRFHLFGLTSFSTSRLNEGSCWATDILSAGQPFPYGCSSAHHTYLITVLHSIYFISS